MEPTVFDALTSPRRRAILRMVWDRELMAGEIAAGFDVSWPAISQNLGVLRRAGLVVQRRVGTKRLYRADQTALGPVAQLLQVMWAADLVELKNAVESDGRGGPKP